MFKIPSEIYDRVIQLHIHGYSMEQIARIIGGISKTTVHNIIHDWNQKISAGSIEDIRFFMRTLRESGITIEKCIEGFRIQQMLKEFGIPLEELGFKPQLNDPPGSTTTPVPNLVVAV